jgi:competence protein ComEC
MTSARINVAALAVAALNAMPLAAQDHAALRLTFFALDHGEATLVQAPGGAQMLMGAGGIGEGKQVVRLLKQRGVKQLDSLVINTWKDQQVGGAVEVLKGLPVNQFFHNPIYIPTKTNTALFEYAKRKETSRRFRVGSPAPGEAIILFYTPPCQMTAVSPTGPMLVDYRRDPNCSMMLELSSDKVSVLNLGESTAAHQRRMWHTARVKPEAQVLVLGRGGDKESLLATLLKPLKTRVAIIPVARKSGRKPAAGTLAALRKAGVKTYRTDTQGSLTMTTDGRNITVRPVH